MHYYWRYIEMNELEAEKNQLVSAPQRTGTPRVVTETVSGNDLQLAIESVDRELYLDALTETTTETTSMDMTQVCERLDTLNATLIVLTFFTIFVWVETKITSGVRRLMKHE